MLSHLLRLGAWGERVYFFVFLFAAIVLVKEVEMLKEFSLNSTDSNVS